MAVIFKFPNRKVRQYSDKFLKRIIELGGNTVEEVFTSTNKVVVTNPLEIPDHDE